MAGTLVPLVMLPRYTTLSGASTFTTIAMDVTRYQSANLSAWRGRLFSSPGYAFKLTCQESTDPGVEASWTTCTGTNAFEFDPGEESEGQIVATLTKRWFRVKVELTGSTPQATCWAVGFLEDREK